MSRYEIREVQASHPYPDDGQPPETLYVAWDSEKDRYTPFGTYRKKEDAERHLAAWLKGRNSE